MTDVGIITDSVSPRAGGLYESVRLPAIKLAQRGERVTVYGIEDEQSGSAATREAWRGPALEVCAITGPRRLRFSAALLKRIMAADHQVLHLHGLWQFPSVVTGRWSRIRRRPAIVSPRGMLDPWAVRNSGFKKRVAGMLFEDGNLARAAVLHALNASEAEAIRDFGLTNPIAIIPNGVDLPEAGKALPRPAYMAGDKRRVVLFLGRLHAKKGIRELIGAWGQVIRERPAIADEWRIVIAGWDDGGHANVLAVTIREAGLERHVTLAGPVRGDDKARALSHASAFVLPSHSEGMPMAVLEAWSYGLPVFMTKACNLPQGFEAGAAIEIETDPMRMAAVLQECLDQPGLLAATGEAGRAFVATTFTWDRVADELQRLYGWVAGGGQQPEFII